MAYSYNYAVEDGYYPKYNLDFSETTIRKRFIRKVFITVTIMIGIVAIMSAFPFIYDAIFVNSSCLDKGQCEYKESMQNQIRNSTIGWFLYILSYITFMIVYLLLVCVEKLRRKHPVNLILTCILTLSMGFMTMMICAFHNVNFVMFALVLTTICCASVIIFASQPWVDFTRWMGVFCILGFALFIFGLFAVISYWVLNIKGFYLLYCFLMVMLLMGFLAVDVQLLIGGRTYEISPEDHIFISIQLFLDIILIFWYLLTLLTGIDAEG